MAKNRNRTHDRHEQHENVKPEPTEQQLVAERAYLRFCERGREPGHDVEDWLAAEQEVLAANNLK